MDAETLTPLQAYYLEAINLALVVGGLTAVLVVFTCGFLILRGMAS